MNSILRLSIFMLLGSALTVSVSFASQLSDAKQQISNAHSASQASQQRIDQIDDETRAARNEYLNNERLSDVTEASNQQLAVLIEAQQKELADLTQQMSSLEETDQTILPLLNSMVDTLRQFVEADLPFLQKERQKRLTRLENLLQKADVNLAEKYRQILEAYMIEVEYGRTFESYTGVLQHDETEQQVNYLRLGRMALYFQTLDGDESGLWLPNQNDWKQLTNTQNLTLLKAIEVAEQLKVPELIDFPLPPLEPNS